YKLPFGRSFLPAPPLRRPRSSRGRLEGWPLARPCLLPSFEMRRKGAALLRMRVVILHTPYSAGAAGLLNSEVAPPADVRVAVTGESEPSCDVNGTVTVKRPCPSPSDIATVSPKYIAPSLPPGRRLANTSTAKRDCAAPSKWPATITSAPCRRTTS